MRRLERIAALAENSGEVLPRDESLRQVLHEAKTIASQHGRVLVAELDVTIASFATGHLDYLLRSVDIAWKDQDKQNDRRALKPHPRNLIIEKMQERLLTDTYEVPADNVALSDDVRSVLVRASEYAHNNKIPYTYPEHVVAVYLCSPGSLTEGIFSSLRIEPLRFLKGMPTEVKL